MDPVTSLETGINQETDPVSVSNVESDQEMDSNVTPTNQGIDPASTCKVPVGMSKAGSNQEGHPVSILEAGSNEDIGILQVVLNRGIQSACTMKAGSESLETDLRGLMELFALQIQTCVFTEKGVEIQIMKVTNVLSLSCICLKCKEGFVSQSKLKLHMKEHSQDDGSVSKSAGRGTLDRKAARLAKFKGKRADSSKVNKHGAHKRKSGARKKKDVDRKPRNAGAAKQNTSDTDISKVKGDQTARTDSGDGQLDGCSDEDDDGVEIDIAAIAEKCSKLESTKMTRRKVFPKRSIGENSPTLTCYHCGKNFSKPSLLKEHCSVHTGEKSHPCPICGRQFRLNKYVTQHMRTHTGEKPHICSVCGKAFSKLSYLKCHAVGHTGERPHLCTICGKTFSTLSNLRDHAGMHEDRSVRCRVCGKSFSHRGSLSRHMKTEHEESSEDHTCKVCGKVYKGARRLKKHSVIHNKPYSCSECGQKFSMKYLFLNHMRKHTGEKPFECTVCGMSYRLRTSLMDHVKKVHARAQDHGDAKTTEEAQQPNQETQSGYVALLESPSIPDMNWGVANLSNQLHAAQPRNENVWHVQTEMPESQHPVGLEQESRRGEAAMSTDGVIGEHSVRELGPQLAGAGGTGGGNMEHLAVLRDGARENSNPIMPPALYM